MSPELVHLIREPARDPEGALILNHGRGTSERDLYPLLDELDPERRLLGLTPGAPLNDQGQMPVAAEPRSHVNVPPGGRHWYLVPRVGYPDPDTFAASYAALTGFLDGFLEEREIGWAKTVIGGFSMGAVMSYAVALGEGRPSPAAVVALSGFIPTVEGWEPHLEGREGLPVFVHHGRNDPIISVEFGRRAAELLRQGGLGVDYLETDAAHSVPLEAVAKAAALVRAATPA
jgi:phospholipase/carboxylesterase